MTQTKLKTKPRIQRTRGADHVDTPPKLVPVAKRRRGRPEIEVLPAMKQRAIDAVLQGATMPEVSKEIGISVALIYQVFGRDEEFLEAIRRARETFDERVINTLAQRAVGYEQPVEKVFSNGMRVQTTEHVVPDTAAAMIWLRNRKNWRSSDNVAQDAIDAASQLNPDEPPNTRTLALAAIALLASAVAPGAGQQHSTIDVTPNAPHAMADEPDEDDDLPEENGYDDRDEFDLD